LSIDAIIFDSDGTLVDSETLSAQVIVEILADFGAPVPYAQVLQRFRGCRFAEFAALLLHDFPVLPVDRFTVEFRMRTNRVFATHLQPMPGALALVSSLEIEKCVASNGPRDKIDLCLGVTGLLPYFDARVASAYEVGSWKPEPGLILHAAAMMGVPARHCLLIEDSLAGVEAGIAAGVNVVGYRLSDEVRSALSRPVAVIAELAEVRDLLP
jgi:HAD superfamily hydrolase (TIGR01509 family)